MHKFMKRALTLALAGVMTLGMGVGALAADPVKTEKDTTSLGGEQGKETGSNLTNGPANADTISEDTEFINLIKDYQLGDTNYTGASNTSTFYFTIERYGVWNAGSSTGQANGKPYSMTDSEAYIPMPAFDSKDSTTYNKSINAEAGKKTSEKVYLPTYMSVGDFWYTVKENYSNASGLKNTGVLYGTNDKEFDTATENNNKHGGIYYMHVQVVNNDSFVEKPAGEDTRSNIQKIELLRSVTLHTNPPIPESGKAVSTISNDDYNTWTESHYQKENNKVNDIQNKYYAGALSVTKNVTGNAGDKNKRFQVTVTFTKPDGTIINSTIKINKAYSNEAGTAELPTELPGQVSGTNWKKNDGIAVDANSIGTYTGSLTNTIVFWIKDGETVTFNNIPYGITYTVKESDPNGGDTKNKYQNSIQVSDSKDNVINWSGTNVADVVMGKTGNEINKDNTVTLDNDFDKYASGSIADASDTVTITNQKETSVDVGVILDNAPYVAILAIAAGALVIFLLRRKTTIEE